jgi:hypothetical protein
MIKLKDLLKELESRDNYYIANNIMEPRLAVRKYFDANKESLEVLMDQDRWNEVYQLIFKEFPQFEQHILSTAINSEALDAGWLTKHVPVDIKLSIDVNSEAGEIQTTVSNWVGKNKNRLIKLADNDEYKNFYQAVKDEFPDVPEDKLLFAFNVAAVEHDIHYDVLTDGVIKLKSLLKESSAHDEALSYTEEKALELAHKNWSKFTGKVCNNGFCDIYADKLSKLLPGSKRWSTEEYGPTASFGHVWVEYKGKYYDAETPDGVADWKELPWMKEFFKYKKQYPKDIEQL